MRLIPIKVAVQLFLHAVILIILIWLLNKFRLEKIKVEKTPGIIYMLQWTPSTTEPFAFLKIGAETFQDRKCPIKNCFVTGNRMLLGDVSNFDVVLFHGPEVIQAKSKDMPQERKSEQIYVFSSMESAGYYPVSPNKYEGYFNLTWTYKLDSDIYFGYLVIKNRLSELIGPSENIQWLSNKEMLPIDDSIKKRISTKKKAAAWFASNCRTPSKRYNLVQQIKRELMEHGMSVDVYGRCGDLKCPRSSMYNCLKLLQTDYYFYFAFENSFAEDYVTEKLLYALNHYTVPVVLGGANYTRFMPDGSYLDATKLSPKALVRQMIGIIRTPRRYHEFFKWRSHYSYHDVEESPDIDPYCKLCEYTHTMKNEKINRVVQNFRDWWNPRMKRWIRFQKI